MKSSLSDQFFGECSGVHLEHVGEYTSTNDRLTDRPTVGLTQNSAAIGTNLDGALDEVVGAGVVFTSSQKVYEMIERLASQFAD